MSNDIIHVLEKYRNCVEPKASGRDSPGQSWIGYAFVVSIMLSVTGLFMYLGGKSDSWLPTDEEVYGIFMVIIGGVMLIITWFVYWTSKD